MEFVSIKPFDWEQWIPLWRLRFAQLAEHGIFLDAKEIPTEPQDVGQDGYEWDIHHIAEVYLSGAGGFWLAWWDEVPIGCVGAQDLGGIIELRRMYVKADYRRRGIGTRLVQALIRHCRSEGVRAIELWTAENGPGCLLYEKLGFREADMPGPGFENVDVATGRLPGEHETRMRLDLTER